VITAGTFELSFSSQEAALAAARESRTRGFIVEVTGPTKGCWRHRSRGRATIPVAELMRYESRLRHIATTFDGRYEGFTSD
jgi:hypothetical protein